MSPGQAPPRRELRQLRRQTREALEGFLQGVLDEGQEALARALDDDHEALARALWREGLVVAYRLLFVIKLERSRPAPRLIATERWTRELSPTTALGPEARALLEGDPVATDLEASLRETFRLLRDGDDELGLSPLQGSLFAVDATPLLEGLQWGEHGTARLLTALLFQAREGDKPGELIPYQELAPEVLGWVYEALIDLEPGISVIPMRRLRHQRLEVVLSEEALKRLGERPADPRVRLIESLPPGRFFLRAGLGRKSTGAYYTPISLVRFLVRQTLDPLIRAAGGDDEPHPERLLELRLVDPAMGSGHFLVEACRHLGEALAEASERCLRLAEEAPPERSRALRARVDGLTRPPGRLTEGLVEDRDRARALCRRLVAISCLHGVDRNPQAVELARLTLWLEVSVEGVPLPCFDHQLLEADSLLGPSLEDLGRLPASGATLDPSLSRRLGAHLETLGQAHDLAHRALEARAALDDRSEQTAALSARLEALLWPLRRVAAAWCGAVMLAEERGGSAVDQAYLAVLEGEGSPGALAREMLELGRRGISLALDFPELGSRGGFDAVLGNPPWDKVLPLEREFYATYDLGVLLAPTARERRPIYDRLRRDPAIRATWEAYAATFARARRYVAATYHAQSVSIDGTGGGGRRTSGHGDSYRYFLERSWAWLSPRGRLGLILPNSFYGAQGSTGVRRLLLRRSSLELCLGFTNAGGLFEIGQGQRFCLVVAQRGEETDSFLACFGLEQSSALDGEGWREGAFPVEIELLERASPGYLCFLELATPGELEVARALLGSRGERFGERLDRLGIVLYQEMNMTSDSSRFARTAEVLEALGLDPEADPRLEPARSTLEEAGYLLVHEKGTFHCYDDLLKAQPRYLCHREALAGGRPGDTRGRRVLEAAKHYRLAARSTIHATETEKSVLCLLPPGAIVGNSALTEAMPQARSSQVALTTLALCNSRPFNFFARLRLGTNLNQFLLESFPTPPLGEGVSALLAHLALRLVCNHSAYLPLWRELLGERWREAGPPWQLPALGDEAARGRVRAAADALVALAYGLDRRTYGEALAPFTRAGLPKAFCLEAYDELLAEGLPSFAGRYDPYSDVLDSKTLEKPQAI